MTDCSEDVSHDETVEMLTRWAKEYPTRRFAIIKVKPDDLWQSKILGWGLAFPDHVAIDYLDHTISTSLVLGYGQACLASA